MSVERKRPRRLSTTPARESMRATTLPDREPRDSMEAALYSASGIPQPAVPPGAPLVKHVGSVNVIRLGGRTLASQENGDRWWEIDPGGGDRHPRRLTARTATLIADDPMDPRCQTRPEPGATAGSRAVANPSARDPSRTRMSRRMAFRWRSPSNGP